jgi:hypothetical protein
VDVEISFLTTKYTKQAQSTQSQDIIIMNFVTFVKTFELFVVNGFRSIPTILLKKSPVKSD